jgi:hypothetical protein
MAGDKPTFYEPISLDFDLDLSGLNAKARRLAGLSLLI